MSGLENLKKQIDQKGYHDFYEVVCFWRNAKTQEEKIEIAKKTLDERFPYGYFKPEGSMGRWAWSLELKKCHGENVITGELPPYKGQ